MSNTAKRIEALERRLAALEVEILGRRAKWEEIESGWRSVLLEFCDDFRLNLPDALKNPE